MSILRNITNLFLLKLALKTFAIIQIWGFLDAKYLTHWHDVLYVRESCTALLNIFFYGGSKLCTSPAQGLYPHTHVWQTTEPLDCQLWSPLFNFSLELWVMAVVCEIGTDVSVVL